MDEAALIKEEGRLARAINAGDRRTLLEAQGRPGVVARCLVRGDRKAMQVCVERFAGVESPVLGPWLEWATDAELSLWDALKLPESFFWPNDDGPEVHPSEYAAWELQKFQDDGMWRSWDQKMHWARVALPGHPRLAIAEARAQRERSRGTAWRLLASSVARFPNHFTLGRMLSVEILWALFDDVLEPSRARELWQPLEPQLALDPLDMGLLMTGAILDAIQAEGPLPKGFDAETFDIGEFLARTQKETLPELRFLRTAIQPILDAQAAVLAEIEATPVG